MAPGAAPEEVFTAVAEEVGQLLPVDQAALCRYEPDGALTFVSQWGKVTAHFSGGAGGCSAAITSARSYSRPAVRPGSTIMPRAPRARSVPASARRAYARRSGRRSSSGPSLGTAPFFEAGAASGAGGGGLGFVHRAGATAIANAESRSELAASRRGSSPPPTRPAAGWSTICTTVPSSAPAHDVGPRARHHQA